MKKIYCLLIQLTLILSGCYNVDDLETYTPKSLKQSRKISLPEAIDISQKVLASSFKTRNIVLSNPSVDFVVDEAKTRSVEVSDTLAYVINYPNDNGFVIVSNQPTYSYEQAVDSMAKLIYWIGKDLNMNYTTSRSGASSFEAHALCKKCFRILLENTKILI